MMGRTRSFDTEGVIRAARAAFWEHGYEDTAIPALEQATGLSRSSIYHAFGSKRGLFGAVIDSYLAEIIRPRLRPLTGDAVTADALGDYLRGLRTALGERASVAARGCLLVSAASAPIGSDAEVAAAIRGYDAELHAAFGAGLAAQLPELGPERRAVLTQACVSLVIAAFVLVRVDPDGAQASVQAALALVEDAAATEGAGRRHGAI